MGQEARLLPSTTSGPSCTESDTPQPPPHDASPTHTHYSPPSCRPRHRTRPPHQVDVLRVQPTRQRERAMKGFRSVGRSPTDPGRVQRDLTALPTPTPPSHRRRTPPRNDHPLRHLGTHHRCPHPARSSLTRHHQTRQPHPDMPSATPAADNVTAPERATVGVGTAAWSAPTQEDLTTREERRDRVSKPCARRHRPRGRLDAPAAHLVDHQVPRIRREPREVPVTTRREHPNHLDPCRRSRPTRGCLLRGRRARPLSCSPTCARTRQTAE